LQTTNPVDPRDINLLTKDTNVPIGSASALLGNSYLGLGNPIGPSCPITNVPVNSFAGLDQIVNVPTVGSGQNITLKFNYIIYSQDKIPYDKFAVYITDMSTASTVLVFTDGNKIPISGSNSCTWYRVPSAQNPGPNNETSGWAMASINLNGYQGKQINVSFQNSNGSDGWYNTYTYLDNVEIVVGP